MANGNIAGKTALLVIVLILIGYLYFGVPNVDLEEDVFEFEMTQNQSASSNNQVLLEVTSNVTRPTKRQVVTDRFTQNIDENAVVVVVDGSNAYSVRKGTVLVDDNIIRVSDESYSVDFTENPRRIVSSD